MRTLRLHTLAIAALASSPSIGLAQDLDSAARALDLISKFAASICNDVAAKGSSSSVELSGSAKAEVNKLVKQLADLKVEGAAKYQAAEYEGVLQKDLAVALKDSASCKQKVFQDLNDKLLPKQAQKVSVVIRSDRAFIDNRKFGQIDGSSTLELKVNGKTVTRRDLDRPFGSHQLALPIGEHSFEFIANIVGGGSNDAELKDNCVGNFSVTQSVELRPLLVFEKRYNVGVFAKCTLERA